MKKSFEAPVVEFQDVDKEEKEKQTPTTTQVREQIIAAAVLNGKSLAAAGREAYPSANPKVASNLAYRRVEKGGLARLIEAGKRKILQKALRRHRQLLSADKVTPMSTPTGIVRVSVPDNKVRLDAVELSYRASGLVGEKASTQPPGPSLNMSVNLLSGEPPVIIEWVMREGRLPSPQERSVLLSPPAPAAEEP